MSRAAIPATVALPTRAEASFSLALALALALAVPQVGCARACRFCSTGTMGLVRNLDAHEILFQVWLAHRFVREQRLPPLVNVVFMGMGEPLNNLAAVSVAVRLLTHPQATRTLN